MTELTDAPISRQSQRIFQSILGNFSFNLLALIFAALVFSLGKLTVYAASQSNFLIYSASAVAISQCFAVFLLSLSGKYILRLPGTTFRTTLTVAAILIATSGGTKLFEAILLSWNLHPISQSALQRTISLAFAACTYLGFDSVFQIFGRNFKQVDLAKSLLTDLSKKQIDLTREIREARTFSIREISLEIQSTLGTIENYSSSNLLDESSKNEISKLQKILGDIEIRVNQISSQFPGLVRIPRIDSKPRYSASVIISASTKPNMRFPILIAVVAFFGFCSWLSYFMNESHALFWGIALSFVSFCIFLGYEKYIASNLLKRSLVVRILVFEIVVSVYLFFWLVILGFFAGNNSGAYSAALAYAAIPFIFFNVGAILSGIIISSQDQREILTIQATILRKELAKLDQIRSEEDKVWKSLFAGDIALSPTTASVILRDASLTKEPEAVAAALTNVNALWNSVLLKISSAT